MNIPTREECLLLLHELQMPPHIQRHSMMVAKIALHLGNLLNTNSLRVNLSLLEAGALLHDVGKPQSIFTGERHEELGASILAERGYRWLAPIVMEHVSLDRKRVDGPINESILVNYSDKRVRHDQVVTLEDRFDDLMDRYAKTEDHRSRMKKKFVLFRELEQKIFEHLSICPSGKEIMTLTLEDL